MKKEKILLREGLTKTNIKINGTPIKIEDRPIATPRCLFLPKTKKIKTK